MEKHTSEFYSHNNVLHTYTVHSIDYSITYNGLSWKDATDIARTMKECIILTIKNNCVSAVRIAKVDEQYGDLSLNWKQVEKTIINKDKNPLLT